MPTQTLFEHATSPDLDPDVMSDWPEMKYMPANTVQQWRESKLRLTSDPEYMPEGAARATALRRQMILELHRAGAGLLLGSDAPQIFNVPGFSIHRELELMVASGLTPFEALQTGTVNPARFFNAADRVGTIRAGLEADLVLLDADPLQDVSNTRRIHGVMLRGRWLPRWEIDNILERFER